MDEHSESERSLTTQSVVDNYLKEPNQSKSDPLLQWKRNQSTLPHLINLVKHYLCAPPASAASKRQFNTAGNICTELRNCLVEFLLFLNENLHTLDYDNLN